MPVTISNVEDRVLRWLGEADTSSVAVLETGTNTTPAIAGAQTFLDYYNAAAAEICRTCYPLHNVGSLTLSVGQKIVRLGDLALAVTPATGDLWSADGARFGTATLQKANYQRLKLHADVAGAASATPEYWAARGEEVLVHPAPSASGTLTVPGLCLPPVATAGSDVIAWCPEDRIEVIEWGVAVRVAWRNREDPQMAARLADALGLYGEARAAMWTELDADTRRLHYPAPPVVPGAAREK